MGDLKINHVAVWMLAVLHQVVGFFWYSPYLFADKWVQLTGLKPANFENQSPLPYAISFLGAVVTCYAMAWLFRRLRVETASRGLQFGLVLWSGFLFFELLTFNSFELKPYELAFINAGKSLVTFVLSSMVLGAWIKKKAPSYRKPSFVNV